VSYLIDTNVLSELRRKQADSHVVSWFAGRAAQSLFLSVLTLGEIRKGIDRLADGNTDAARRRNLNDWIYPHFFWAAYLVLMQALPTNGDTCKLLLVTLCLPSTVWLLQQPCNII